MNPRFLKLAIAALVACLFAPQATAQEQATNELRSLLYYQAISWGTGGPADSSFLFAIEVDFPNNRFRQLNKQVQAPREMLPHHREGVEMVLGEQQWQKMTPQRIQHLRTMFTVWKETNPPDLYLQERGVGKCDGHVEILSAQGEQSKVDLSVNGHHAAAKNHPSTPPPEWHALLAFLAAL
jgi:hypothetical protein